MLKLLIWTKYNILLSNTQYFHVYMEALQSNWWLFLTLRKTGSHASFFFCNLLVKDYIKIWKSVPGNWDFTWCLVSTDVSRFDKFFLKLITGLHGKPHKSRFDVSVPACSTAVILHC